MDALSAAEPYLGLIFGLLFAITGFWVQGLEGAILWAVVGYFVGKALQSTLWTFTGGPPA